MEENKFKKGIDDIHAIRMNSAEKERVFANLVSYSNKKQIHRVSPWSSHVFVLYSKSGMIFA